MRYSVFVTLCGRLYGMQDKLFLLMMGT